MFYEHSSLSSLQVMCVLINVASASEKTRDTLIERDDILNGLATILVLAVYNNYIMCMYYSKVAMDMHPTHIHVCVFGSTSSCANSVL